MRDIHQLSDSNMANDNIGYSSKIINILGIACLIAFLTYVVLFLSKFYNLPLSNVLKDWADFATAFSAPLALLSVFLILRSIHESRLQSLMASQQQRQEAIIPLYLGSIERLHSRYQSILNSEIRLGSGAVCTFEELFSHHDKDGFAKRLLLEKTKKHDYPVQPSKKKLNSFILTLKSTLEMLNKYEIPASLYWNDVQPMFEFLETVNQHNPLIVNELALKTLSEVKINTTVRYLREANQ